MRVPDLDWPEDLFDDAIAHAPRMIATLSPFPDKPTLWKEMAGLWIGNDAYISAREGLSA